LPVPGSDSARNNGRLPEPNPILMTKHAHESYHVLLADDSDADRLLFKMALHRATRLRLVAEVSNGRDAIAYLNGDAHFADRRRFPLPQLLLLDLKMPHQDGFDVLEWLREQPALDVTVVVLTDSMDPRHIKRALDLGADLFQVKPSARHDREAMVLALEELVARTARTPQHESSAGA